MIKTYGLLLTLLLPLFSFSQKKLETIYTDKFAQKTTKKKAVNYIDIFEVDGLFQAVKYSVDTKQKMSVAHYSNKELTKPAGFLIHYDATGFAYDSSFYTMASMLDYRVVYYSNGKIRAKYQIDPTTGREITEGYDKEGNTIPLFIFEREAAYITGIPGWTQYLANTLDTNVPLRRNAPRDTYQVIIQFIVEKDGSISNIEALTDHGYGMENEAIRVIKKSPKWKAGIFLNEPVRSIRRQPITFVVD